MQNKFNKSRVEKKNFEKILSTEVLNGNFCYTKKMENCFQICFRMLCIIWDKNHKSATFEGRGGGVGISLIAKSPFFVKAIHKETTSKLIDKKYG